MNLGIGFAENIKVNNFLKVKRNPKNLESDIPKFIGLKIWLFFLFALLSARVFYLQVLDGKKYQLLSERNRVKIEDLRPLRGVIYDRLGASLARSTSRYRQKLSKKILSKEKALELISSGKEDEVEEQIIREYPEASATAQVVGLVGQSGLEKIYEGVLGGVWGKAFFEVDTLGNRIRKISEILPRVGADLHTTLSANLQQRINNLMQGKKGAVVVTNPKNGEILALVSAPSFDPNLFVQGSERIEEILNDKNLPLFDRAISGSYPPGSTFKIIMAVAALSEGKITPQTKIEDVGIINLGRFSFSNWYFKEYGKKEGMVDLVTAIKRSNDIFFYKVGEFLGLDKIHKWGKIFLAGEKLGIDLPEEVSGLLPTEAWKQANINEGWFLGDTYHLAIGQGYLLSTPLQVNAWISIVANGGKFCRPYLNSSKKPDCQNLGIKKEFLDLVKDGMKQACAPGGTGWPLFKFKIKNEKLKIDGKNFIDGGIVSTIGERLVEIPVICKTGTAEYGDPNNKTHAWITGFAPIYNPEISVTVLIEGGGQGSDIAGPIMKEILKEYFESKN